jgi:hypothetical protein
MGCVQRQQGASEWQSLASEAVGQQTKVADAHEASGQHVKEEASQELAGAQSQRPGTAKSFGFLSIEDVIPVWSSSGSPANPLNR